MPQGPLSTLTVAKSQAGGVAPLTADASGVPMTTSGGLSSALNVTAATVIKASPGRLIRLVILTPGTTSGAWTFNDTTTVGGAAAANAIFSMAFGSTANVAGAVIYLDFPCQNGIVLSAVPGGGSPVAAISYV